jgi:hypothetical protein
MSQFWILILGILIFFGICGDWDFYDHFGIYKDNFE